MSSNSRCAVAEWRCSRRAWWGAAAFALCAPASKAHTGDTTPPYVRQELPSAQLRGQGHLRVLGWHIYDAQLWMPPDVSAQQALGSPLILELRYSRAVKRRQIVEHSLAEMRRIATVSKSDALRWHDAMQRLFPDVSAGDRLAGVHLPGEGARFYFNDRLLGEVREAAFAERFFAVWLSPQTAEPSLRAALLGAR